MSPPRSTWPSASGAAFQFDYRIGLGGGITRPVAANGTVVPAGAGRTSRLIGTVQDITERRRVEDELTRQALQDPLTGLANRTLFSDRVEHVLLDRTIGLRSVAVMYLDLDRFKEVNDTAGHAAGDVVLCEVARRLTTAVRPADTVARVGGDEFAICLEGLAGATAGMDAATRVLAAFARPVDVGERRVQTSVSIGVALNTNAGSTALDLLASADTAMYRAKSQGGGRWVLAGLPSRDGDLRSG